MMENISGVYTLKQIFQDHWEPFKVKYGNDLREAIVEEVEKDIERANSYKIEGNKVSGIRIQFSHKFQKLLMAFSSVN